MATEKRRALGLVAVLVIGLVVGLVVGFVLGDGKQASTPDEAMPNQVADPGPTDEVNGVPVGYARTEEGAVAAATNFHLLSARDDLLDQQALRMAMETLAAPEWKEEAARQAKSGYEYVVDTYGADADVSAAVLGYEVVDLSSDRANVRLWTVTTLSGSRRPNVEEVWGIVTIDLVWASNDWRVRGIESDPGPAPVDLPGDNSDVSALEVMEDFNEFEGAPAIP